MTAESSKQNKGQFVYLSIYEVINYDSIECYVVCAYMRMCVCVYICEWERAIVFFVYVLSSLLRFSTFEILESEWIIIIYFFIPIIKVNNTGYIYCSRNYSPTTNCVQWEAVDKCCCYAFILHYSHFFNV